MRHSSAKDFKWKKNELLFEDKIFMGVVQDKTYPNMYWIKYPDNMKSLDFYNLTRAKDHCLTEAMQIKTEEWN